VRGLPALSVQVRQRHTLGREGILLLASLQQAHSHIEVVSSLANSGFQELLLVHAPFIHSLSEFVVANAMCCAILRAWAIASMRVVWGKCSQLCKAGSQLIQLCNMKLSGFAMPPRWATFTQEKNTKIAPVTAQPQCSIAACIAEATSMLSCGVGEWFRPVATPLTKLQAQCAAVHAVNAGCTCCTRAESVAGR
jgi:hypothetical protein